MLPPEQESLLREWERTKCKEDSYFWSSEEFRTAYAVSKMPDYVRYYVRMITSSINECLEDLSTSPRPADDKMFVELKFHLQSSWLPELNRPVGMAWRAGSKLQRPDGSGSRTVRVLSFGTGPGTDLLAIATVLADDASVGRIECVGVDLLGHPLDELIDRLARIARPNLSISLKYLSRTDLRDFVHFSLRVGLKFDIVSARYINAIDKLDIFRAQVPSLLGDAGLVLLLDNLSTHLEDLTNYGYIDRVHQRQISTQIFLTLRKSGLAGVNSESEADETESEEMETNSQGVSESYVCDEDPSGEEEEAASSDEAPDSDSEMDFISESK